jgi:CRISPR-associated protein (TIGR03986 family)
MSTRPILDLPKHVNPSTADRTACAPYNFIPLPEKVVAVKGSTIDEQLPDHDRYFSDRHNGYFDVTLTTKSPLYVRCPFTRNEFDLDEQDKDRNGHKLDNHTPYADRIKNTPDFFYTHDRTRPVIPGSSLRGMLRSVLEIVSYGNVQGVADKKLFFRTVDKTTLGKYYSSRMMDPAGTGQNGNGYRPIVEGGFIRSSGYTWEVEPCTIARVEMQDVARAVGVAVYQPDGSIDREASIANLYTSRGPMGKPNWEVVPFGSTIAVPLQYRTVFVLTDPAPTDHRHRGRWLRYLRTTQVSTSATGAAGERTGTLVLTGPVQGQHMAFVFLPQTGTRRFQIPNDLRDDDINNRLIDLFHDKDQLTQWQEQTFERSRPSPANRNANGFLRNGEPAFFLREAGRLTFFGRAQMFRLPYKHRPLDLVPPQLCDSSDIDYPDAVFGFIRNDDEAKKLQQGDKGRAYAGRLFVTDAELTQRYSPQDLWLDANPFSPQILATPKPTAVQQYLAQKEPDLYGTGKFNRGEEIMETRLRHYDGFGNRPVLDETVIRGHKRYWHQDDRTRQNIEDPNAQETSSQHTQFKPVKSGVQFTFRVYFENLSDEELGALCWTLRPLGDEAVMDDPQKGYCHSLGMGKPLGMGAVNLEATLHSTDRPTRYSSLIDGDNWQTGEAGAGESLSNIETLRTRTEQFEKHILDELQPLTHPCDHLRDLKRIGMLLKIMEWPGYRPVPPSGNLHQIEAARAYNTRYMTIGLPGVQPRDKNEYKNRPVLPDPSHFGTLTGDAEPMAAAATGQTPKGVKQNTPVQAQQPSGKTAPQPKISPQTKPPKVSFQPPTKPVHTETKRETVTLTTTVKNGKAHVRTAKSEEVVCTALLTYPVRRPGDECRADVTYESGKAVRAVFKDW